MKGVTMWSPGVSDELLPVDDLHAWMSEAGINSIFGNAWDGRRPLGMHEVAVVITEVAGSSERQFQLGVRTTLTRADSPPFGWNERNSARAWLLDRLRDVDEHVGELATHLEAEVGSRIEVLVQRALFALHEETSALRDALEAANLRIGLLEGQLYALTEAKATGRTTIVRALLGGVAAILLAATTGVAEGIPAIIDEDPMSPSALVAECLAIEDLLDTTD